MTDPYRLQISKLTWLIEDKQLTQKEISRQTGVHQSQVSRILSGQGKRLSKNAEKLCNYAKTLQIEANPAPETLTQSLLQIWDGSPGHAAAIMQVLRSLDQLQISYKKANSGEEA
jgi:transcriptional regulator with XRE-family HTH domain